MFERGLIAALTLATGSPLLAQQAPSAGLDSYWIGAGVGVGSNDFAATLNLSYRTGADLFSFRAATTAGIFSDSFGDLALLYGRTTRAPDRVLAGIGLGVAVAHGCKGGGLGGCRDRPAVMGLPLETQLFWHPGRAFGIGLYGFADINQTQSFAGVTLAIQLGRLR